MSPGLIGRLRGPSPSILAMRDAATEIERLRAELARIDLRETVGVQGECSDVWVVLNENGLPIYCASWPEACHEHINDAINEYGVDEAKAWKVIHYSNATHPAAPVGGPAAQPAELGEAVEMSPEFTDTSRGAIAWVLYHHQGGSSPVGQPLRFALGMGAHERLSDYMIGQAKRWAAQTGATTSDFHVHPAAPVGGPAAQPAERQWSMSDKSRAFEWLRGVATADDAPEEAGIALDTWYALAMASAQPAPQEPKRRKHDPDCNLSMASIEAQSRGCDCSARQEPK